MHYKNFGLAENYRKMTSNHAAVSRRENWSWVDTLIFCSSFFHFEERDLLGSCQRVFVLPGRSRISRSCFGFVDKMDEWRVQIRITSGEIEQQITVIRRFVTFSSLSFFYRRFSTDSREARPISDVYFITF